MQKVNLKNKSYKQFLVKNESGAIIQKKLSLIIFFQLKLFLVYVFKLLYIVSCDWNQKSYSFYKKKLH